MATYRLEAKHIGRSRGKSAAGAAAYISGEKLTDERTGIVLDYRRRQGVLHAEIVLPNGANQAWLNRNTLWNSIEAAEDRLSNKPDKAITAYEYVVSLPHEMTHEQRLDLVRGFVKEVFVDRGMCADFAIHKPDKQADQRNIHCHILVSTRVIGADKEFGLKNFHWFGKQGRNSKNKNFYDRTIVLQTRRKEWSEHLAAGLTKAGIKFDPNDISHLSLKQRGINAVPEPKLGAVATEMERRGRTSRAGNSRRAVKALNAELAATTLAKERAEAEVIDLRARRAGMVGMTKEEEFVRQDAEIKADIEKKLRKLEEEGLIAREKDAKETLERIEKLKTDQQREQEKAAKDREAAELEQERRRIDGMVPSAEARHVIAVAEGASTDPFTSITRIASIRSAMFLKGQDEMRLKLESKDLTDIQRAELTRRKEIDYLEYRAHCNMENSGFYRVIGGKEHTVKAGVMELNAKTEMDQAKILREERKELLKENRHEMGDKIAELAKTIRTGKTPDASKKTNVPGSVKSEGEAEQSGWIPRAERRQSQEQMLERHGRETYAAARSGNKELTDTVAGRHSTESQTRIDYETGRQKERRAERNTLESKRDCEARELSDSKQGWTPRHGTTGNEQGAAKSQPSKARGRGSGGL